MPVSEAAKSPEAEARSIARARGMIRLLSWGDDAQGGNVSVVCSPQPENVRGAMASLMRSHHD